MNLANCCPVQILRHHSGRSIHFVSETSHKADLFSALLCWFCTAAWGRWPPWLFAVLADDVPDFLNMFSSMQCRLLRGLLAIVSMLQRLERTRCSCLLLPHLFRLRRHVPPPSQHTRDAFVRVFLVLALSLDCLRLRFKFHAWLAGAGLPFGRDLSLGV